MGQLVANLPKTLKSAQLFPSNSVESNTNGGKELMKLLKIPVDIYEDTLRVLKLEYYPKVLQLFDYHGRKQLATHLATIIVEKSVFILTPESVSKLFLCVCVCVCLSVCLSVCVGVGVSACACVMTYNYLTFTIAVGVTISVAFPTGPRPVRPTQRPSKFYLPLLQLP